MTWNIVWSGPARRDLRQLSPNDASPVLAALDRLAEAGYGDVRPLQGQERRWRLRVGDVRVVFTYEDEGGVLRVVRALPRGRAYRP